MTHGNLAQPRSTAPKPPPIPDKTSCLDHLHPESNKGSGKRQVGSSGAAVPVLPTIPAWAGGFCVPPALSFWTSRHTTLEPWGQNRHRPALLEISLIRWDKLPLPNLETVGNETEGWTLTLIGRSTLVTTSPGTKGMVNHINSFSGTQSGTAFTPCCAGGYFNLAGWALVFPAVERLRQYIWLYSLVEIVMEVSDKNWNINLDI